MIWGNPKSLEIMRELGYKTFDGLLDESYDQKGYVDRAQGIIDNLVNLRDTDLMDWFERCRDICEHNYENLMANVSKLSPAVQKLMDRYDQLGV